LKVTKSSSGGISSTDAIGCTRTGQATLRAWENVYDNSVTAGAACPFAGPTFTGIGGLDETKTQLIALMTNSGGLAARPACLLWHAGIGTSQRDRFTAESTAGG
jgi:hypothetical protein